KNIWLAIIQPGLSGKTVALELTIHHKKPRLADRGTYAYPFRDNHLRNLVNAISASMVAKTEDNTPSRNCAKLIRSCKILSSFPGV
ncbi:hypothetical protein PT274_03815, partial [Leuconostocaceae bacterium ESL0958]|nr:hypothetical protein [Leuconostocaceae bacterium ESL0958]